MPLMSFSLSRSISSWSGTSRILENLQVWRICKMLVRQCTIDALFNCIVTTLVSCDKAYTQGFSITSLMQFAWLMAVATCMLHDCMRFERKPFGFNKAHCLR